jgi:hypothetical protein
LEEPEGPGLSQFTFWMITFCNTLNFTFEFN